MASSSQGPCGQVRDWERDREKDGKIDDLFWCFFYYFYEECYEDLGWDCDEPVNVFW